jgi:hypothetical protein
MDYHVTLIGCLLRPDIVHFHPPCTEIFLRELTLSNTLSSNPKSSRSADLVRSFLTNCNFIFTNFKTNVFIVQRHGSMTTNDYVTQKDQFLLTSLPFNKRPFCSNHFELCNPMLMLDV